MSNYPPGVTGNEFAIAGPDYEAEEYRECDAEGVQIVTLDAYHEKKLKDAIDALSDMRSDDLSWDRLSPLLMDLREVWADIEEPHLERCTFKGEVLVAGYAFERWWDCPACRTRHDEERPERGDL